ncbi:unnamed protein product [Oikopleura dioica]|uniref:Uncharacterized protein n=1 Tax=Oikopleura dioica TaxID=34765 RepID=E4XBC2_OIKDI|nr:unnamed protein product [Oikopleura dioica]
MAPIAAKAVQTPALGLSTSEIGHVEEVDYSWYDSDTKNIFYPQSPILNYKPKQECYMYEYYRENEEPLTIKECLFLYQKILRLRNNDSRKVNAVSEASVTTRISTEGALKITQTEPSTTTSIPAPKKGEISTSQISKFPISEKVTTQAPISSEFWTSEPFVIDDSGILDAFSETASSSNEDDSSVESAASTTANELATTTVAKTTTTQSDNYYDCLSKKYVSFDGIELTFEECQTLAEMIPRDLLPLYMKDATVDESLPPTADESLTTAHKAFILKLIGLPECSDAKVRQVSKHFARRKVKVLSAEKNCPNISVRLQLTSGATKKHVSHLLPQCSRKSSTKRSCSNSSRFKPSFIFLLH